MKDWRSFVLKYGWRSPAHELAQALGVTEGQVQAVRASGGMVKRTPRLRFAELFALWRGFAPAEADWPTPRREGGGSFEWQAPEEALLATLVGQVGPDAIAHTLTQRLRDLTGDPTAQRTREAVLVRMNSIGLQTSDILGGMTVAECARQMGSRPAVETAIRDGELRTRKVGRHLVIGREQWTTWLAERSARPQGKVRLSSIRQALGIRSDAKLAEFAKLGYIETAELFKVSASRKRGDWYLSADVARKLVEDRVEGRPMPWHGRPIPDNLKATYRVYVARRHPEWCPTCAAIWSNRPAPSTFEEFCERYPSLMLGAKRHLTMVWTPGLTITEVAQRAQCAEAEVVQAIRNGALKAVENGGQLHVSRTCATRWVARGRPLGDGRGSWIQTDLAQREYEISADEMRDLIDRGALRSKRGQHGAMRGIEYVLRQQCAEYREENGFTLAAAARRARVTEAQFLILLDGVGWRQAEGLDRIRLSTVQAVIKRIESREGIDIESAAIELGVARDAVESRVKDGSVRVTTAPWNPARRYFTWPMFERLKACIEQSPAERQLGPDWLFLSEAAREAGVSSTLIIRWAEEGGLVRRESSKGWRYLRDSLRDRARLHWASQRLSRAVAPDWLAETC